MKKRILFVDDDAMVLQGLQLMLRSMRSEWEMEFVDNAEAALRSLSQKPFDVIVSDMRMPRNQRGRAAGGGHETAPQHRALDSLWLCGQGPDP